MNSGTRTVLIGLAAVVLALASCRPAPTSGLGLSLPDGDINRGQAAFINLQCTKCHTVRNVDLPTPGEMIANRLEIGGEVIRVKTYGELVTSIIHPDHTLSAEFAEGTESARDAELHSPMPDLTKEMSVAQMVDLVAFLHSRYREKPLPDYSKYQMYP